MGIALYFELLRTLAWAMVAMFLFGLPSLIITFAANPDAAADAVKAGGPLGVLRSDPPDGPPVCSPHAATHRPSVFSGPARPSPRPGPACLRR